MSVCGRLLCIHKRLTSIPPTAQGLDEAYTIVVQLSLFRVYMSQIVRKEIHINCFLHHSYNLINIIRVCVVALYF